MARDVVEGALARPRHHAVPDWLIARVEYEQALLADEVGNPDAEAGLLDAINRLEISGPIGRDIAVRARLARGHADGR